jgi:hypothetical protein
MPATPLLDRRTALRVGGAGLFGLGYPELVRAAGAAKHRARAKSVILLFQWGGPGQHETFDPKPDAPDTVRGWYGSAPTAVPGVHFGDQLPRVAKLADKLCVVRCMKHSVKMNNHNSAGYYALTGVPPPTDDQRLRDSIDLFPGYGSVVSKLAPAKRGVATAVSYPHTISDGSITPGQHASFLGKSHDPLFFADDPNRPGFSLPELTLPAGVTPARLQSRTELMKLIDKQTGLIDHSAVARGVDQSYQQAAALLTSPKFREAFDLTREPDAVRDRYGRTTYGQSCLLARRLAEAGAKFVTVYFSASIGGPNGGWDYHGFNKESVPDRLKELLPLTDQTLSALVTDLHDRGTLDETLVVWVGEFGRTPKISGNGGRDHWPACYTAVLAGAGAKGGFVYGASDKLAAHPTTGSATPEDLAATMFAALGIDPDAEVRDTLGRPLPAARGKPIRELFA